MEAKNSTKRNTNPWDEANSVSKLLFLYMLPIFRRNYKTGLKESDLYSTPEVYQSKVIGDEMEEVWKLQQRKHKSLALHRTLLKLFGFEIAIIGLLQLIRALMMVTVMPTALGHLVSYFDSKSELTHNSALLFAGLIITNMLSDLLISTHSELTFLRVAMKFRLGCCSMIYRKCLKLSQTTLAQITVGQIINLLSNDAGAFDHRFLLCHYSWIAPIQTIVGTYLLYNIIGVSAFSGIFLLLLFIPLQGYLGKITAGVRLKIARKTDERVRLMNEILNGIQVIKMYCWEKPFSKLILLARREEIEAMRTNSYIEALTYSLDAVLARTAVFISIAVFLSLGYDLDATIVYSVMAIYDGLRQTITHKFPFGISSLSELHVAMSRIQTFLMHEEVSHLTSNGKQTPRIFLENVTAQWLPDSPTLKNININIEDNKLIGVIGPVGSGKTSLLNIILKELPVLEGCIDIEGTISYAPQQAWLFSGSVRQNILFGEPYVEDRYKTVIRICALESDLALFPLGDCTVVGEKGKTLSGGQKARINLARCVYKDVDIYLLDDPLSAVDAKVGKQLYQECIRKFLADKICILVTHQLQYLINTDEIMIIKEGTIIGKGTYNELKSGGLNFAKLLHNFNSEEEQVTHNRGQDAELSRTVDKEQPETEKVNMKTRSISAKVYAYYFKAGGSYLTIALLFLVFAARQAMGNFSDHHVAQWVNAEQNTSGHDETIDRNAIIYSYSTISFLNIVLSTFQTLFFYQFAMRASTNLHNLTFTKIHSATMKFFDTNAIGTILNRFSKDLNTIDNHIPYVIYDVIYFLLQFVGLVVVTSIANRWLLLPAATLSVMFYFLRKFYLQTSRNVKRIEGITRNPIVAHVTSSMSGISTIRAFSAQDTLKEEFDHHQDLHSSSWLLYITSSRATKFWLDLIGSIMVSIVIIALLFNKDHYGGEAGLILTQYLTLANTFQWGVRVSSSMENSMVSVESLLEYLKIETEPIRKQSLVKNWLKLGQIVFQNVTLRYNPDEEPVLMDLSFAINHKEKIGIVGRTGAGKSSMIAVLFQLYNIEGSIVIDGVDISTLPLKELRSKISIIPQDPVLFSGTVRKNLDPFNEYSNETLWEALEQVELQDVIADMVDGLSSNVAEGGSNFSIGQRQLLCLARAIIRNNQILVMDEATANVDPYTDGLIQKTISKRFDDCTVITVAHRLHTIMGSDRVLVMEAGRMVEIGRPYELLQNTGGYFFGMVQTTGTGVAKHLYDIAKHNHMKIKNDFHAFGADFMANDLLGNKL